jgi:magnesium transporter
MQEKLDTKNLKEPITKHLRKDFTTLRIDQTVMEAMADLRSKELSEQIIYFYVLDRDDRLIGVVPTRRLLMSDPACSISDIMVSRIVTIPDSATVLDACEFFVMHRFLAFPVVDEQKRLLGVADVSLFTEGVFDVAESEAADDIFQLIGVHAARGRRGSAWSNFAGRFPWLMANIAGGLLCAVVAGFYEVFLDTLVILALFIPIVLALAESVSIQSMTITLQEFHGRQTTWTSFLSNLGKEFVTAALLGLASGATVGAITWLWKGELLVAIAIWASIAMSMVTACLLGVALPTVIHVLRRDPRIAAGPLVLAITDIATLLFYFNIAGLLLQSG